MKTLRLGDSDIQVSRLAYGCWRMANGKPSEEAASAMVHAAVDAGYTFFDHADIYGGGECERLFGRVLAKAPGLRKGMIIASKCGIRPGGDPNPDSPHRYDFSAGHLIASVEGSLRRLGVDYLDLLLLHRPDYLADPAELTEAFHQLHRSGKVRAFGVSNFRPSLVALLVKRTSMPLLTHQVEISLARLDSFTDGVLDQCLEMGLHPMAWSPLAGGLLGQGSAVPVGHPRAAVLKGLFRALDAMATQRGISREQLALAWLLKHPAGIIPIVGSTQPQRIRQAADAAQVELSREDWYTLLNAARGERLP
jgi:predicted oxidoreductase